MGVLSEHRAGTPLPSDRAVQAVYGLPKWWSNYCFGVRGKQEPLEESAIPLRSDSLITVLLAAACRHTGAGGRGGASTETHTHKKVFTVQENAYAKGNLTIHTQPGNALLALRDYLPVSSTNHFKCPHLRNIV